MRSNGEITHEEQQALKSLSYLLSNINARQLRQNVNELFYGYLNSEMADSLQSRNILSNTHSNLIQFLTKISNLQSIDRLDRK